MQRAAWIAGLGLVFAVRADAQERLPLELEWNAPVQCGSAAEVRAEIERITRVLPGFELEPLWARADVERRVSGGYAMRLATVHEGRAGERRLEAVDCRALVRTVTLVLALAFGKGVEVSEETAAATPEQAAVPAPEASPTQRGDVQDVRDAVALRATLLLGAGVQLALMPEPAAIGSLGLELDGASWSVALRANAWPGSTAQVGPGLEASFDGIAGALRGCGQLPLATLGLALCGQASAAALRGRSRGAFDDGSDTAPWYALAGAVALTWPQASAIRVRIEAALAASLARPRFVVAGFGPVHRVPQLAPQLGALLLITP